MINEKPKSTTPYHDHLDVCDWCAEHPFDLCPTGNRTIREEAAMIPGIDKAMLRADPTQN
jgi:hypothetical protein